jgi:transposase
MTIPGVSTKVADVIIAETGADMTSFPTAAHLASWVSLSGLQRVGRSREVDPHPSGQSLLEGRRWASRR